MVGMAQVRLLPHVGVHTQHATLPTTSNGSVRPVRNEGKPRNQGSHMRSSLRSCTPVSCGPLHRPGHFTEALGCTTEEVDLGKISWISTISGVSLYFLCCVQCHTEKATPARHHPE